LILRAIVGLWGLNCNFFILVVIGRSPTLDNTKDIFTKKLEQITERFEEDEKLDKKKKKSNKVKRSKIGLKNQMNMKMTRNKKKNRKPLIDYRLNKKNK
jgi:DUF2075 family protein